MLVRRWSSSPLIPASVPMQFLDVPESGTARGGPSHQGAAADPRRRRLRQDPRHHQPDRVPRRRRPRAARRDSRGHLHEQGRRRNARARRGAARLRLQPHVGLDVSLAVRAAAAPRGAGDRPLPRFRHLRLVRSAVGRQAGAQGAAHRRQLRPAAGGAVAHQPREEPDGGARGRRGRSRLESGATSRSRRSTRTT